MHGKACTSVPVRINKGLARRSGSGLSDAGLGLSYPDDHILAALEFEQAFRAHLRCKERLIRALQSIDGI